MLTDKQISIVENSWDTVLHNSLDSGIVFYKRLFETEPGLRKIFKGDINIQAQKLVDMITFVVHKLRDLQEMIEDVKELGLKHRDHGVLPEHYPLVASTLLWTLERSHGNQWNEDIRDAWIAVYTTLAQIMLEATESVRN